MTTYKRTKKKTCVVDGCESTNANSPGLSFFSLPSDPEKRATWLRIILREDLKNSSTHSLFVCEEHFDPAGITSTSDRKRLSKYTVPSLKLPKREYQEQETQTEIKGTLNKFVQTDFYVLRLDTGAQTAKYLTASLPAVQELQEELKIYKKMIRTTPINLLSKVNFHMICDKYLSKPLATIVKAQTKLTFQHSAYKFSPEYKQFCINLFYTAPKAYKLVQSAMHLPDVTTLAKPELPISTVVNENTWTILKTKVQNMSDSDKICSVVIGSVTLKTALYYDITSDKIIGFEEVNGVQSPVPANYALVVMISSIFGNWKQPIGFALLAQIKKTDQLSIWIEQLLEKLIDVGLDIRAFVSELRLDLLTDETMRQVTTEKPYFFIKNVKIYYILDSHNLIITLRNNLLSRDFYFNDSVAKYEHIKQFYENDKYKSLRLAPKLSEAHINPSFSDKLKVQFATELLSHSVATGISCYIDFNVIHESARNTVKLIKQISDLFDFLNSSTVQSTSEKHQAFCGSDEQTSFMREMISFFKSLKLVSLATDRNRTGYTKFIKGFQITITSILQLHSDLRLKGHPYLPTSRLNQDVLNKCGIVSSQKQTTKQFMSAFVKTLHSNLIKSEKQGSLSELLQILSSPSALSFNMEQKEPALLESNETPDNPSPNIVRILRSDYNNIKLPETNVLSFIAGFILSKCKEKHGSCDLFRSYLAVKDKNPVVKLEMPEVQLEPPEEATEMSDINMEMPEVKMEASEESTEMSEVKMEITEEPTKLTKVNMEMPNPMIIKMEVDDAINKENSDIIPPLDFLHYVQELEKCYQRFFDHNFNNQIFKSTVESMSSIVYKPPCECFPINYVKSLFTRIRIFITVKYNNEDYRNNKRKNLNIKNF